MQAVSLDELAHWTSKDRRTVKARLNEAGVGPIRQVGKKSLYASDVALGAIYATARGGLDHLSPTDKLAHARWEKAELELRVMRGELLARTEIVPLWQKAVLALRSRLLSIPSKLAPQIAPPSKVAQVKDAMTREIYEALEEVAGDGISRDRIAA